ncbi:MAG: N-acetyltransferase family protein [Nocardioides sp.]|uniref:GNAT family N-acetyltransferase n=1 Tax=Nocardioides sp. TaxID=35761 RepID=UPI003264FDE3
MLIRPPGPDDLSAVASIYNHEVDQGVATFDTEHRPDSHWQTLLADGEPLFVAADECGVQGYASAFPYRPKLGYRFTREASIYVAPSAQGQGLGRRLYAALLADLEAAGMHLVLAAVALPNPASLALHRALGFDEVGTMREVGHKHDRWIDVTWLQKRL